MPKRPLATVARASQQFAPPIPDSDLWTEHLHWCLKAMAYDDPDVGFIGSLLAYAHNNGGLTTKQAKYAERTIKRVRFHYSQPAPEMDVMAHEADWFLRDAEAKGRA